MGWYGGQNGNIRRSARTNITQSYDRFQSSLPPSTKILNYTTPYYVKDNHDLSRIGILLYNQISQPDLLTDINKRAASPGDSNKDLALAIAFTWFLNDFDNIDSSTCNRLVGLYIFSAVHLEAQPIKDLLGRCPNLKSLTIAYMNVADAQFIRNIFAKRVLPNLEFLEVSHCSDDAIAAMASAPELKEIVFRFPDNSITDTGFKRLVENGGATKLMSITGSINKGERSTFLTKKYLKAILPLFVNGRFSDNNLKAMICGNKIHHPIHLRVKKVNSAYTSSYAPSKHTFGQPLQATETNSGMRRGHGTKESTPQKTNFNRCPLGEIKTSNDNVSIINSNNKMKMHVAKVSHNPTKVNAMSQAFYSKMKVVTLKEILRERGLKVGGRKLELIQRLQLDDNSPTFFI